MGDDDALLNIAPQVAMPSIHHHASNLDELLSSRSGAPSAAPSRTPSLAADPRVPAASIDESAELHELSAQQGHAHRGFMGGLFARKPRDLSRSVAAEAPPALKMPSKVKISAKAVETLENISAADTPSDEAEFEMRLRNASVQA